LNAVPVALILDEIQLVSENGKLLDSNYDVVPDIVVMGKGMGGGMPVGALPHQWFIGDDELDITLGHCHHCFSATPPLKSTGKNHLMRQAFLKSTAEITQTLIREVRGCV
jgi:4-aminobutyrate aminotransferase-like enzyme